MFVCDESGQTEQIDSSVNGWRGAGGAEGEVEQERQVIVSLGVEVDLSDLTEQQKEEKEQKTSSTHSELLWTLSRKKNREVLTQGRQIPPPQRMNEPLCSYQTHYCWYYLPFLYCTRLLQAQQCGFNLVSAS